MKAHILPRRGPRWFRTGPGRVHLFTWHRTRARERLRARAMVEAVYDYLRKHANAGSDFRVVDKNGKVNELILDEFLPR